MRSIPQHRFWTEDIEVSEAFAPLGRHLLGHQQITDAYLLGLAIHKKGRLATLDADLPSLLPEQSSAGSRIAVL
jgi:predicted nucleic acid-binding protein